MSYYWEAVRAAKSEAKTEREKEIARRILKPFWRMMRGHFEWTVEEIYDMENMYFDPCDGEFKRGE